MLKIFCDGGSRGNPGKAASAIAVYDGDKLIETSSKYLGVATNNTAEYQSLIMALSFLANYKELKDGEEVQIAMDSQLIIRQFTGVYKVKDANLKKLYDIAKDLEKRVDAEIDYHWQYREKNKIADALVNEELDRA